MYMSVLRRKSAIVLQSPILQFSNLFEAAINIATVPRQEYRNNSPLGQAQQQVLLCALREAGNPEPAHAPVAVLILGASADANGILDHIATGRGRVDGGCVGQAADELHLCESAGSGGGEGAGAGARQGGAEGEHCEVMCVSLMGMVLLCVFVLLVWKEWKWELYAY